MTATAHRAFTKRYGVIVVGRSARGVGFLYNIIILYCYYNILYSIHIFIIFRAVDVPPLPPPRAISVRRRVPLRPPPLLVGGTVVAATSPYQVPPPTRWRGGSCTPPRAAVVDIAPSRTHAVTVSVRRILCLYAVFIAADVMQYHIYARITHQNLTPARPPSSSLLCTPARNYLLPQPWYTYISYIIIRVYVGPSIYLLLYIFFLF